MTLIVFDNTPSIGKTIEDRPNVGAKFIKMHTVKDYANCTVHNYSYEQLPYGAKLYVQHTVYKSKKRYTTMCLKDTGNIKWGSEGECKINEIVRYFLHVFPELRESPYSNMNNGYQWQSKTLPIEALLHNSDNINNLVTKHVTKNDLLRAIHELPENEKCYIIYSNFTVESTNYGSVGCYDENAVAYFDDPNEVRFKYKELLIEFLEKIIPYADKELVRDTYVDTYLRRDNFAWNYRGEDNPLYKFPWTSYGIHY